MHLTLVHISHRGPRRTSLQSQRTTARVLPYDKASSDLYHSRNAPTTTTCILHTSSEYHPIRLGYFSQVSRALSPFTQEAAIRGDPRVNYPTSAPAFYFSLENQKTLSGSDVLYPRAESNRRTKSRLCLLQACVPHRVTCWEIIQRAKKKAPTGPPKGASRSWQRVTCWDPKRPVPERRPSKADKSPSRKA